MEEHASWQTRFAWDSLGPRSFDWASQSHFPALLASRIRADRGLHHPTETAEAARKAFGAKLAFTDSDDGRIKGDRRSGRRGESAVAYEPTKAAIEAGKQSTPSGRWADHCRSRELTALAR